MSQNMVITHYYHSGFSVSCDDSILVFDYWLGEEDELKDRRQLDAKELENFKNIIVFISHEHIDHLDQIVYTWNQKNNIKYIVSSDMPIGVRGKRLAPGESIVINDGIKVTAFDSTDLGVSFLVNFKGKTFFHAGDLNFWHWRDESTAKEIEEAEEEFRKAVKPLEGEDIDIAFFPVDPRQGSMYDAGANYFILSVKPRLLIPMHYFHRGDIAMEFARRARNRYTEVLAMPGYGDRIEMITDDEGYTNIRYLPDSDEDESEKNDNNTQPGHGRNPFEETDLPISLT